MVAVLALMVLLMAMAAAIQEAVLTDTRLRAAHQASTAGFYAAEAGVNQGVNEFRNIFIGYNVPSGSDFEEHAMTLGPRTVRYQLSVVPGFENGVARIIPAGRQFEGLDGILYRYVDRARSELVGGDVEATIGTEFDVEYIPLFQFLAFYQGDLEITPAPNMTMHGPVHTNADLYLNCGSTLTIADMPPTIPTVQVSVHGRVNRGRAEASTCYGQVRIAKLADVNNDGALDVVDLPCSGRGTAPKSAAELSNWLGAVKIGVPRLAVPTPGQLRDEYWGRADLRIVLDLKNPDDAGRFAIFVANQDGTVDGPRTAILQRFMSDKPGRIFYNSVPRTGQDTALACSDPNSYCNPGSYRPSFASAAALYPCAGSDLNTPPQAGCANGTIANEPLANGTLLGPGAVTARRGGFYNNRERAWVAMLNVNIHDLLAWNRAQPNGSQLVDPNDATDGGLVVFLGVDGPDAGIPLGAPQRRYGVRVFGSSDLDFPAGMADPTGLTLASDRGFYLEGNYNAGTPAHPKMPAAVLADTINVLSSGWSGPSASRNDFQSRQPLATRDAGDTAINAAFVGGVDRTAPGDFSGGLENYPRFHEDWNGVTLVYRGSFVSLGSPVYNDGHWCGTGSGCNIYEAPIRNWDFDTDFRDAANLPPLTPRAVTVEQILFAEDFR